MGARPRRSRYEERRELEDRTRFYLLEHDADDAQDELADHGARLRSVEQIVWKVIGAATAGGVLAGAVSALLLEVLTRS